MANEPMAQDIFIDRMKKLHPELDFSKTIYVNANTKITVTCSIHGDILKVPYHLLHSGCKQCAMIANGKRASTPFNEFIKRSKEIHGDKFEYDESTYSSLSRKTKIKCPDHGWFWQIADNHVRGKGCSVCRSIGFTKKSYISRCNKRYGGIATLYIILCTNDDESFYKVGITMNDISLRFNNSILMPYKYHVINAVKGAVGRVWDTEKAIHKELSRSRYSPKISFGGSVYECFSELNIKAIELFNSCQDLQN